MVSTAVYYLKLHPQGYISVTLLSPTPPAPQPPRQYTGQLSLCFLAFFLGTREKIKSRLC